MERKPIGSGVVLGLICAAMVASRAWATEADHTLKEMPAGYHLLMYDDCGIVGLQPHVRGTQTHTFSPGDVNADERARSVAWDARQIDVLYESLDRRLEYVAAVIYASEPFNNRVQSLWVGSTQLHGPHALSKGKAERLLFRVPAAAIEDGRLALHFKLEGPVNVVVSAVELWAPAASPKVLRLEASWGPYADFEGRVLDLGCNGVAGAVVQLQASTGGKLLATTKTAADGTFRLERRGLDLGADQPGELRLMAMHDGLNAAKAVPTAELSFEPVRYRPAPAAVGGLKDAQVSLDGTWRINLDSAESVRSGPLDVQGWGDIKVPGQWVQQGYDVPQDKAVVMAKEFDVPAAWKGYRVILRFESVHAGTRYWLNGTLLGSSENLFTPVEWDITEAARVGGRNRLDLEMKVDTVSEQLSYSCGYAFHNLGGIDRSVRIFALPAVNMRSVHVAADLDGEYRDGKLRVELGVENCQTAPATGLTVEVGLTDAAGKPVSLPRSQAGIESLPTGIKLVTIETAAANPLQWNAEQPNLYALAVELRQNGKLLERIERNVGFRKIEIRERQLYVNGRRVKLAGACHHETDPLTGRADTARHAQQDVMLCKSANLNLLRTSHYPPTQELLDACDRLGMYVECEAPFCWVNGSWDLTHWRKVLTPTSAMIDCCHTHPSVIYWSLANESSFCKFFEVSNVLCKELDPTRPTTFNNPDPKRICDIANLHYPLMPYEDAAKDDPRPVMLGEYFFPICHEQTDARINPGLRELWGAGHSDPDSEWGKLCAANYVGCIGDGGKPGVWSYVYHSNALIGGAIWAALDEPYYLPNDKRVGYAWVHGFWGLIDGWRRPKPEHWLAKLIFSPVWFPTRQAEFVPGQKSVTIPVENRYSFTDLKELEITWEFGEKHGTIVAAVPPSSVGELTIPLPPDAKPGDAVLLRVRKSKSNESGAQGESWDLVNLLKIKLGKAAPEKLPDADAGVPQWQDDGRQITLKGDGFGLAIDKKTGELKSVDGAQAVPLIRFPSLHLTRYDYGDMAPPGALPYAVLPDEASHNVEATTAVVRDGALEVTVQDRYDGFAGAVTWRIDRKGVGRISCDYTYTGPDMAAREVGVKLVATRECDEIRWRRWSEWDVFPEDSISRTAGSAKARRAAKWGPVDAPESMRPTWPWSLDQTELGTNDFRSVKFNVYEASLVTPEGTGVRVRANADVHVRPCLSDGGVKLHLLSQCRMGPVRFKKGDRIQGSYVVELLQ